MVGDSEGCSGVVVAQKRSASGRDVDLVDPTEYLGPIWLLVPRDPEPTKSALFLPAPSGLRIA